MFPTTDSSQTVIDALLRAAGHVSRGGDSNASQWVESIEWVEKNEENEENVTAIPATSTSSSSSSSGFSAAASAAVLLLLLVVDHFASIIGAKNRTIGGGGGSTSVPCFRQDVNAAVILATGSSPAGYALFLRQSGFVAIIVRSLKEYCCCGGKRVVAAWSIGMTGRRHYLDNVALFGGDPSRITRPRSRSIESIDRGQLSTARHENASGRGGGRATTWCLPTDRLDNASTTRCRSRGVECTMHLRGEKKE
jgi:hypothetical protein